MAIDGDEPPKHEQFELDLNKTHEKSVKKATTYKKKTRASRKKTKTSPNNVKEQKKTTEITQETSLLLYSRFHFYFYGTAFTLFILDILMLTIHYNILKTENLNLAVSPDLTDTTHKSITLFILWVILLFACLFFFKFYRVINNNHKNIKEHQPDLSNIIGNDHPHDNAINEITFKIISGVTFLVWFYFILVCMATILGWQIPYLNTFSIIASPLDWVPIIQE